MDPSRSSRFAAVLFPAIVAACGGSVASVDGPSTDDTPVTATPPRNAPALAQGPAPISDEGTTSPSPAPAPATCTTHPSPVSGTASCEVARDLLYVDVIAVGWRDGAAPWKAGSIGELTIRYRNMAANSGIHYPGVAVASSDARLRTDTEKHGDPYVHPDFYMIAECSAQEIVHAF